MCLFVFFFLFYIYTALLLACSRRSDSKAAQKKKKKKKKKTRETPPPLFFSSLHFRSLCRYYRAAVYYLNEWNRLSYYLCFIFTTIVTGFAFAILPFFICSPSFRTYNTVSSVVSGLVSSERHAAGCWSAAFSVDLAGWVCVKNRCLYIVNTRFFITKETQISAPIDQREIIITMNQRTQI